MDHGMGLKKNIKEEALIHCRHLDLTLISCDCLGVILEFSLGFGKTLPLFVWFQWCDKSTLTRQRGGSIQGLHWSFIFQVGITSRFLLGVS